jgi:hypothetical protein
MKCPHCPVRVGLACLGEQHQPACRDVANGLPGRAAQLIALAEGKPLPAAPGLVAMAGNFVKAAVAHVADGGRIAPPEVQAARRAECFSSRCGQHDGLNDKCKACGCIAMNLKRSWASSECPQGRWSAV